MADFRPPGQHSAVLTMESIFILLQFVFLSGTCILPRVRVETAFQFLAHFQGFGTSPASRWATCWSPSRTSWENQSCRAWGGITGLLAFWSLTSSILLPLPACLHSVWPNGAPLFYEKKKEHLQLCQICLTSLPWGDEKCSSKGCCPVGVPSKRRLLPSSLLLWCS